jgi:hypothetical protein
MVLNRAAGLLAIVVLSLVAACIPAEPTPTPTPQPTATPVWIQATKPEHLAGIWFNPQRAYRDGRGFFYRFEEDGTIYWAPTLEDLQENPDVEASFWFQDGVYYEEGYHCVPIGSYRAYLHIAEGRAVELRFEEIDDSDRSCFERRYEKRVKYERID